MDYVVAHLLRVLQDTVRWKAARGMLPDNIHTAKGLANTESTQDINEKSIRESHVVEE
eukprot:CAMPEP_0202465252 /NCGR_PEP_ID=MMETSP1360-20130828/64963_1 /ASSEMBLY_ACC=CAM_ASM_000848 /TAXON_ID=515479 /ORGANISM="Licmophora paradoxa, Strain CCMP2313" /LENGTH=57 /DNA_ID=CAMNT_0049088913 /DNA_START=1 /DNA_END=171 /DNA_ORIENTATION=-